MYLKQFPLKSLFLLTGIVAIAVAVYSVYPAPPIYEMPPEQVLQKMDRRFDGLSFAATEDQILRELGLGRYGDYLGVQGGMTGGIGYGGIQTEYLSGQHGYYLTITATLDDHFVCRLKTPKTLDWREKKIKIARILAPSD